MTLRVLFLGSPEAAVPALRAVAGRVQVVEAWTQPDRPAGRGRHPVSPPVALAARELGIPVHQPEMLRRGEVLPRLQSLAPDAALVVAYGKILRPWLLEAVAGGFLNVHFSLLPRHRGAAPVARAILDGDERTGVSLMRLDAGLDTGPLLAQEEEPILADDTTGALTARLAQRGARMLTARLDDLLTGGVVPRPQPESGATYAAMLEKSDGAIRWDRPAVEIDRRIRAVSPWPGAFGFLAGGRLLLLRARPLPYVESPGPGRLQAQGKRLIVGCADACLELLELQREGRKPVDAAGFLAGAKLPPDAEIRSAPPVAPVPTV